VPVACGIASEAVRISGEKEREAYLFEVGNYVAILLCSHCNWVDKGYKCNVCGVLRREIGSSAAAPRLGV